VPIIVLFVVATALLGETQVSKAQSAYSYPWCAISGGKDAGSMTCYYTTWQQCMTTQGIGGNCIESPYYHAQATTAAAPFVGEATPSPARPHMSEGSRVKAIEHSRPSPSACYPIDDAARSAHHWVLGHLQGWPRR